MLEGCTAKFRGANAGDQEKIIQDATNHIERTWKDGWFDRETIVNVCDFVCCFSLSSCISRLFVTTYLAKWSRQWRNLHSKPKHGHTMLLWWPYIAKKSSTRQLGFQKAEQDLLPFLKGTRKLTPWLRRSSQRASTRNTRQWQRNGQRNHCCHNCSRSMYMEIILANYTWLIPLPLVWWPRAEQRQSRSFHPRLTTSSACASWFFFFSFWN